MEQLITLTILITFTFFIIKTIRDDRREYKLYTLDKHTCLLSEIDENTRGVKTYTKYKHHSDENTRDRKTHIHFI